MTLELIALDKHWAQEIAAEGSASLAASCSNFDAVAPYLDSVVDAHIALYEKTGASAPWIAYLARLTATREFVGVCSFKDKLTGGRVEIAYYTFPPYEGQGYGKAMAGQLVDLALRHPDVTEVTAETLPQESASTRILRRLNFRHVGSAVDADEGEVWTWVLTRSRVESRVGVRQFVPMMRVSALFSMLG